jgi:hypothetical protein
MTEGKKKERRKGRKGRGTFRSGEFVRDIVSTPSACKYKYLVSKTKGNKYRKREGGEGRG